MNPGLRIITYDKLTYETNYTRLQLLLTNLKTGDNVTEIKSTPETYEEMNKEFEEEDTHRPVGCFTGLTVESFGQPSIVSRCRFECVALFLAQFH